MQFIPCRCGVMQVKDGPLLCGWLAASGWLGGGGIADQGHLWERRGKVPPKRKEPLALRAGACCGGAQVSWCAHALHAEHAALLDPQVTDTPGLLNRKDEERNAMERLTLASLQYLPTAVRFACCARWVQCKLTLGSCRRLSTCKGSLLFPKLSMQCSVPTQ